MNLLRHAILLQLEAAAPATLPADTLRMGLKLAGHDVSPKQIQTQIDYLSDKQFVEKETSVLDHAHPRHRLTAAGRDYLEAAHLI